ncbi:MAG: BrnT family toxin [Panacagrimonas sp.]
MLVWNEAKRIENIAKHGYDFVGVDAIFDGPVTTQEDTRAAYAEQRIQLLGWLHGHVMHLTYTDDGEVMRAISLREATTHEKARYFKEAPL